MTSFFSFVVNSFSSNLIGRAEGTPEASSKDWCCFLLVWVLLRRLSDQDDPLLLDGNKVKLILPFLVWFVWVAIRQV